MPKKNAAKKGKIGNKGKEPMGKKEKGAVKGADQPKVRF